MAANVQHGAVARGGEEAPAERRLQGAPLPQDRVAPRTVLAQRELRQERGEHQGKEGLESKEEIVEARPDSLFLSVQNPVVRQLGVLLRWPDFPDQSLFVEGKGVSNHVVGERCVQLCNNADDRYEDDLEELARFDGHPLQNQSTATGAAAHRVHANVAQS